VVGFKVFQWAFKVDVMSRYDRKKGERSFGRAAFVGIAAMCVGVLVLMSNLGWTSDAFSGRWLGLLPLIAALVLLLTCVTDALRGRFVGGEVATKIAASICLTVIAVIQLAGASWHTWWPLVLIAGGLLLIVRRWARGPADRI
jgi:hypothetical protein